MAIQKLMNWALYDFFLDYEFNWKMDGMILKLIYY